MQCAGQEGDYIGTQESFGGGDGCVHSFLAVVNGFTAIYIHQNNKFYTLNVLSLLCQL